MIFEDLQGTTVFEIPIYALSPKEHRSRYKRKISSETKKLWEQGVFGETAEKKAKQFCQHLSQWKYNQLVGMFCLSINNIDPNCDNSLLCHLYCNESFPRTISSHSYLPFKNRYLIYEKIYLNNITNDEELITAIKEKRADEAARGQEQSEKNESKENRSSV